MRYKKMYYALREQYENQFKTMSKNYNDTIIKMCARDKNLLALHRIKYMIYMIHENAHCEKMVEQGLEKINEYLVEAGLTPIKFLPKPRWKKTCNH